MAKKTLKIGRSNFKTIIKGNHYFVDKSLLIYDFLMDANDILLMPRPRRFGKTLNLSMIEHFFDITKKDNRDLFQNLKISAEKEFCVEHQNQYPVINLSLKNIKASSWEICFEGFKKEISELYDQYRFLLDSDKIIEDKKQTFKRVLDRTGSYTDYEFSLQALSHHLYTYYKQEVVILIDEYDTPIIYGFEYSRKNNEKDNAKSYYNKVIDFMRTFLGAAFKGNNSLKKGLITGIMRVGKESIFSEWDNFKVFSLISPYFSDRFGFTEKETRDLLAYFDLSEEYEGIKSWYDGYQFGKTNNIYNPWSIVNYIAYQEEGFKPHWVNTSSDALIKGRITEPNIKGDIQELINGKTISKTIRENFVFSDFKTQNELLWTLLLYSGYLTIEKALSIDRYQLRIPNYEIKYLFKNIVLGWVEANYKVNQDLLITTSECLTSNDISGFEEGFQRIMADTFSYFDEGREPEKVYQAYTLGLLAVLSDDYIIKSNRESGTGRYDILLIPHHKESYGIVIEIKQIEKQKEEEDIKHFYERINDRIQKTLTQIEKHKYYKELISHHIQSDKIIKSPIVFAGKEPFVSLLEIDE